MSVRMVGSTGDDNCNVGLSDDSEDGCEKLYGLCRVVDSGFSCYCLGYGYG